ncbi:MAG: acetyl-CoA carboxylase subunit beta [Candidatus Lindowbacteria bacterium RIFCSPLOWO2_12_FULL_62_27]|nr:MAG: acetyl-CoA carboxylase subunit beta [Candidatus Lindowbacteria bacterium RIFCSPLOWO2_02_FULL_62_12]OGH62674.1 MAG: acetyl-CoA carboxylase subunit beta [Candidatus Lindowbacteria bacterium RIFCSPLOWO2_12_FULL_62_27]
MAWFKKHQYTIIKNVSKPPAIQAGPEGAKWESCPNCKELILQETLIKNLRVCHHCAYHMRLSADERIQVLVDAGAFEPMFMDIRPANPLGFPGYGDKLSGDASAREAIVTGVGKLGGMETAMGVMEFGFMGGSMGTVVGERVARTFEYAAEKSLPVLMVTSSGGARMQEGIFSLMQMAKTSAAVAGYRRACRRPYVSLLCDPTTGGTTASFAMLGDVLIGESGALIGFAGPRVIEQTIRQKLPAGFQRAEFLLEHGFLDMVLPRKDVRPTLIKIFSWL